MPRLFVALGEVPHDGALARQIAEALASLPAARPAAPKSRHVTLAFIGDVAPLGVPRVEEVCREVASEGRA